MIKVAKFGGSSLAGAEQFRKVRDIVRADESRRFVVVSAAGKRFKTDHKVTDLLYLVQAHLKYGVSHEEILSMIEDRYVEIRDQLGLSFDVEKEFDTLRRWLTPDVSVDELVSRGEYLNARLMAEYLGYRFVDATEVIYFQYDGKIDMEKSCEAIRRAARDAEGLVIPGFYGAMPNGRIRVMSRGGSDITGAVVAAAVDADVYENWTDVSGILMADPKIVKNPRPIPRITYSELRELSFMGASVLHEESILPVKEKNIPLNIRNTNEPDNPGTMIMESIDAEESDNQRFITGIAGRRNFTVLTIYKKQISTDTRILRETLEMFETLKVEIDHITLDVDSFSLVVPTEQVRERIYDIIADVKRQCKPDSIRMADDIALIASVGRKMVRNPGICGKIFQALGENGVNIRMIAQGAEEISIIVGVENADFEKTIRVLYDGFVNA
ncbi:MAG: aspartate kinase [Eubacteriales bacterium]|nr:aspartate kinase [Eubacteriales bacterium]